MKAIVWTAYGAADGLKLADVEMPAPKDNEVLVRIHATSVTAGDSEIRQLKIPAAFRLPFRLYMGLLRPRNAVLGQELAGEIAAVGSSVTRFKAGDQIYAVTGPGFGAYAEYICLPADGGIARKPANMTYAEAAVAPTAGLEALHYLRQAKIQPGQQVAVVGGAGSIGTFGIQIAKAYGATVTGVDHGTKLETMRAIGADHVVDYTRENVTNSGRTFDVIFDVMGKTAYASGLRALNPGGALLLANATLAQLVRAVWTRLTSGKRVIAGTSPQHAADLNALSKMIEAGQIRSVIDRTFPLEQAAEAHRYVDSGQKKGNVSLSVA